MLLNLSRESFVSGFFEICSFHWLFKKKKVVIFWLRFLFSFLLRVLFHILKHLSNRCSKIFICYSQHLGYFKVCFLYFTLDDGFNHLLLCRSSNFLLHARHCRENWSYCLLLKCVEVCFSRHLCSWWILTWSDFVVDFVTLVSSLLTWAPGYGPYFWVRSWFIQQDFSWNSD